VHSKISALKLVHEKPNPFFRNDDYQFTFMNSTMT